LHEVRKLLGVGLWLIGFDISHSRARNPRSRGLTVIVADALRLPLPSGSVALAICRHVIEHVSDDRAALEELNRVLRPGALLYLETPLRLPGACYPYRNADGTWVLDPTHVREYGKVSEVEMLLRTAGFTNLSVSIGPIKYRLSHLMHRAFRAVGLPGFSPDTLDTRGPSLRIPRYREIRVLARSGALRPRP
jgi:SAM-dependent methyltransferase